MKTISRAVRIWETGTWRELPTAQMDVDGIRSVSISPGERLFATGYRNGLVKLWNLPVAQPLAVLGRHSLEVGAVAFDPDGRMLVSVGADGIAKLWDVSTRQSLATFRAHRNAVGGLAFSRDGRRLATAGSSPHSEVKLWDPATRREGLTLQTEGLSFVHAAFSPDGDTLAATDATGCLHLWHAPSFAEIETAERAREKSR